MADDTKGFEATTTFRFLTNTNNKVRKFCKRSVGYIKLTKLSTPDVTTTRVSSAVWNTNYSLAVEDLGVLAVTIF